MMIHVTLPGNPPVSTQKNSIRFNRKTGRTYKSKKFLSVRDQLRSQLARSVPEVPLDGALKLTLLCFWEPPKKRPRGVKEGLKATKPDADNLLATVSDALEYCGYVVNDSRFAVEHVEKHYDAENPRMEIIIEEIE